MKKLLLILLVLVAVATGIVFFFGSGLISKAIKAGVETYGPQVTQTPVRLDAVSLSILSGNGTLEGLYVGNPEGYKSENIFALGRIDIDLAPLSLFSDTIVINKIHIREPGISYEKRLRGSNLDELLANIEASTGGGTAPAEPEPESAAEATAPAEPGKKVVIKSLIIEDGTAYLGLLGKSTEVVLPRIEMTDLGAKEGEGMNGGAIAGIVIRKVLEAVVKAAADPAALQGTGEAAGGTLQDSGDAAAKGIKSLLKGFGGGDSEEEAGN